MEQIKKTLMMHIVRKLLNTLTPKNNKKKNEEEVCMVMTNEHTHTLYGMCCILCCSKQVALCEVTALVMISFPATWVQHDS